MFVEIYFGGGFMNQNSYAYNVLNDGRDEKQAKRTISRIGTALTLYMVIAIAVILIAEVAIILYLGQQGAEQIFNSPYFLLISNAVAMYLIAFPIFCLMVKGLEYHPIKKRTMSVKEFFGYFFASVALMYLGSYIGNIVNEVISGALGIEIQNPLDSIIMNSPLWLVTLVAVIIGPIVEELIFRKIMIERLDKWGDVFSICVSALAFGLFHGNFSQFYYATLLGLLLGYVYTRTGNIKHTILLHISINFFGSILPMPVMKTLEEYQILAEGYLAGTEIDMQRYIQLSILQTAYSIFVMACITVGIILIAKNLKSMMPKENQCAVKLDSEKMVSVALFNVGSILFIIFSAIQFTLNIFLQ